jgi:hypothetical protein
MSVTAPQQVQLRRGDHPSSSEGANDNARPDGLSWPEIGQRLHLSDRQLRRIYRTIERKMRAIPEARDVLDRWNEVGAGI